MSDPTLRTIRAGFIPLVDCAPLVIAKELGFAEDQGLHLILHQETSWATIRDKINLGYLDCAHMLAGMPIAASLGINQHPLPTITPFAFGTNGNAISLSTALSERIEGLVGTSLYQERPPLAIGQALKQIIAENRETSEKQLTFAMVFPFSMHNYTLRYWLAACGIDPDRDVELVVVPPSMMLESLRLGQIDGFCVGDPWNSLAAESGLSQIALTTSDLWSYCPEKVLGMTEKWANNNEDALEALIRSLFLAAQALEDVNQHGEIAQILSNTQFVGVDTDIILQALSGNIIVKKGSPAQHIPNFLTFAQGPGTAPDPTAALWIYTQMVRWGQVPLAPENPHIAKAVFRPDLYESALSGLLGTTAKSPDQKLFSRAFDGHMFDPEAFERDAISSF